ncbi:MAG: tetratricopeptide repeat protein [Oligoflexus sp.]
MAKLRLHLVKLLICLTASMLIMPSVMLASSERYSQMVMSFPDKRAYDFRYIEPENTLLILVKNTLAQELLPIYHYDERVVRRVLFREINNSDTEIRIVLRDQDVRASVYSFEEPFRIVIDIFDRQFQEQRDPQTGLPIVQELKTNNFNNETSPQAAQRLLKEAPNSKQRLAEETPHSGSATSSNRRRLLQASPTPMNQSKDLVQNLAEAPEGVGKRWAQYPVYIFRIQTEPYKTGKSYESWMRQHANQAMESADAMANYAGQLYDFGHESRALLAYQRVLHKSPEVFARLADHLWRLAEIHLGQGNLTLADGYYQSLIERHPDHPLSQFAHMRRLDVRLIQAGDQQEFKDIANLAAGLESIRIKDLPELNAQLNIRRAYWQQKQADLTQHVIDRNWLPKLSPENWLLLENSRENIENTRTAFLIATLLLNASLDDLSKWNDETANYAGQYFETYRGSAAEPFRTQLMQKTNQNINQFMEELVKNGQVLKAVKAYESLPKSLNTVRDSADTSWYIAQAYRQLQQPGQAAALYRVSSEKYPASPQRFRSLFWQLEMLQDQLSLEKSRGSSGAAIQRLESQLKAVDQQTLQAWNALKDEEKQQVIVEFKNSLEAGITNPGLAQTHPMLLLWTWSQTLGTNVPGSMENNQLTQYYSAGEQTIFLLSQLAKRFAQLGRTNDQRQTKNLIRYLRPKDFAQNKEANKLWTRELVELAEIYRQNNEYLEAGRLYTLTGSESENWEGRAEALYKGGLLLYRSGRREEALEAFNKAANDGNNLLYADLAKKRLEQLQD